MKVYSLQQTGIKLLPSASKKTHRTIPTNFSESFIVGMHAYVIHVMQIMCFNFNFHNVAFSTKPICIVCIYIESNALRCPA